MKNNYMNLYYLNWEWIIDDLKSGDHFPTDSVLKQYLFLFVRTHKAISPSLVTE